MDFHGPKSKEAQGNANKAANSGAGGPTVLHCKPFSGAKGESARLTGQKGKTRATGETELKAVNPGARSNRVSFPEKMSSDRSSTTPNRRTRY